MPKHSLTAKQLTALNSWLATVIPQTGHYKLSPMAGDAGARQYFRVLGDNHSWVAVYSPLHHSNNTQWVELTRGLLHQGIRVPTIIASDLTQGFLLLTDFTDALYTKALNPTTADTLYSKAMQTLIAIHRCPPKTLPPLPPFDRELIHQECSLFTTWFLKNHLGCQLTHQETTLLDTLFDHIADQLLTQPYVCVHRDYHARNLIDCPDGNVGVLDFQDAVLGPITYDIISLLRDAYIDWPPQQTQAWLHHFYTQLQNTDLLPPDTSWATFNTWADWTSIQRHLKVIGIFARLALRDHKPQYLQYLPRLYSYLLPTCAHYPELSDLQNLLLSKIPTPMETPL